LLNIHFSVGTLPSHFRTIRDPPRNITTRWWFKCSPVRVFYCRLILLCSIIIIICQHTFHYIFIFSLSTAVSCRSTRTPCRQLMNRVDLFEFIQNVRVYRIKQNIKNYKHVLIVETFLRNIKLLTKNLNGPIVTRFLP